MAISLLWDNEGKTILRQTYENHWTWEDVRAAMGTSTQMLESVNHSVNIVIDLRETANLMPASLFNHFKLIADFLQHPKVNKTAVVGEGYLVKTFGYMFDNIYQDCGIKAFFAPTLDEAFTHLADEKESGA